MCFKRVNLIQSYMRWSCWSFSWVNSVHCYNFFFFFFFFTKPISDYGKMLKSRKKISVNRYIGRSQIFYKHLARNGSHSRLNMNRPWVNVMNVMIQFIWKRRQKSRRPPLWGSTLNWVRTRQRQLHGGSKTVTATLNWHLQPNTSFTFGHFNSIRAHFLKSWLRRKQDPKFLFTWKCGQTHLPHTQQENSFR